MNIQSMTGYGRGEAGNFRVEARSSNQRNLDMRFSIPSYLYSMEPKIRKTVKEKFHRGRIEIFFSSLEDKNVKLRVNRSLAREYYNALISLKEELSIPENIGMNILASQRDIFSIEEDDVEVSSFFKALDEALEHLKKMREDEGKTLLDDISGRFDRLGSLIQEIEEKRADFTSNAQTVLTEKLRALLNDTQIDDTRIVQETAVLVERSDVTEELVRMKSHLKYAREIMKHGGVVGKKTDFLIQELHRELNTIGSKSNNAAISTLVVETKHELEKIREQVQNIQ
jgi:uncharacterized protein (TIGR00255 family)